MVRDSAMVTMNSV